VEALCFRAQQDYQSWLPRDFPLADLRFLLVSCWFPAGFLLASCWLSVEIRLGVVLPPQSNLMKSKKNLTRFTYETAAFEGWRLCISRAGTTFTRYFPDKKLGGPKKSLKVAETTLAELKAIVDGSKRINGKLTAATIKKAEKLLKAAV
jgi:hypothetical protein